MSIKLVVTQPRIQNHLDMAHGFYKGGVIPCLPSKFLTIALQLQKTHQTVLTLP
jgi:hypothetical protein